jgi:Protein phosphatase 2A regulatory B subunit (B56 family)
MSSEHLDMDSIEFQELVERIRSGCIFTTESDVEVLHRLALTKELQDFEWTSSLYDAIWTALRDCWLKAVTALTKENIARVWNTEKLLIQSFNLICKLPEFDSNAAAASPLLCPETVQLLFKRVLTICPSLSPVQHCMHWIYQNRLDLRMMMRKSISSVLLSQSCSLVPGYQKSRHNDGGKGRDHVAPILEFLLCIIEGFLVPLRDADRGLLVRVLMPLHQPNQMVEWRDQIPVLQIYHPQLVDCVKALIEKSEENDECATTAAAATAAVATTTGAITAAADITDRNQATDESYYQSQPQSQAQTQYQSHSDCTISSLKRLHSKDRTDGSLLVTAVKRLLSFWPQSYAANTPKELLMLHELEALVAMTCPRPRATTATTLENSENSKHNDVKKVLFNAINTGDKLNNDDTEKVSCNADKTSDNVNHKESKKNNDEISELLDLFLTRVVLSLGKGGDSDNFRTTQRTLQIFKNKKILKIIGSLQDMRNENEIENGHGSGRESEMTKKDNEKSKIDDIVSSPLGQVFCILIPALYRDGKMSWNPTVNKMTVLVLRSLRALNEEAFTRCSAHVLSGNSRTDNNESGVVDMGKSSTVSDASNDVKEKQTGVSEGHITATATSSSYCPPLPHDQPHANLYSNKKMRSPVPEFNPMPAISTDNGPRPNSVLTGFHVDNGSRSASMLGQRTVTATG